MIKSNTATNTNNPIKPQSKEEDCLGITSSTSQLKANAGITAAQICAIAITKESPNTHFQNGFKKASTRLPSRLFRSFFSSFNLLAPFSLIHCTEIDTIHNTYLSLPVIPDVYLFRLSLLYLKVRFRQYDAPLLNDGQW